MCPGSMWQVSHSRAGEANSPRSFPYIMITIVQNTVSKYQPSAFIIFSKR